MQSGVNNLDYNLIWNKFLERIKQEIQPVNYETWFEETKLIEIKNDYAKKHLTNEFIQNYAGGR